MDDDTYRLDAITKYCYKNNLPDLDNPYKYESKCNWLNENNFIYDEICYAHCPKTKEIKEKYFLG